MKNKSDYVLMCFSFFIYSLSSIFSKLASKQTFLSFSYVLWFCGIILVLGIYAVLWQQILKRIQLSVAMANKPLALVFSLMWAVLLFKEQISIKVAIGVVFVLVGVFVISFGQRNE